MSSDNYQVLHAVYTDLCPICGGPISSKRLSQGLPCSTCLPDSLIAGDIESLGFEERIRFVASRINGVTVYHYLSSVIDEYRELERLLYSCIGKGFWSLQRTWAIRLLRGESFAITAPTGVGKTTLLLTYAIYMSSKGKKVYIIVPTENLVEQTIMKLNEFISRLGIKVRVLGYKSRASVTQREEILNRILRRDYDILITTTAFLSRRYDFITKTGVVFDVLLVDDADSLLKNTKNIDRVLALIGFSDEELRLAYELIKLKMMYAYAVSIRSDEATDIALRIEELTLKLNELRNSRTKGQLVIASATGRQVGLKPKLFKELLDFEVGSIQNYMRNIIDTYVIVKNHEDKERLLLEITHKLGRGGIILVSRDGGVNEAKRIAEFLSEHGIRAALAIAGKRAIEKLVNGEVDLLVGVSSYYGTLVRGIDLPFHIRYVVFVGAPRTKIELKKALQNPIRVLRISASLIDEVGREFVEELSKIYSRLSPGERQALRIAMMREAPINDESRLGRAYKLFKIASDKIVDVAWKILSSSSHKQILVGTSVITLINNQLYLIVPDALSYIQASGRTSRFTNNGMTLGLSIILESSLEIIEGLKKKLDWYLYEFEFVDLQELDLDKTKHDLDKSRTEGYNNISYKPARAVLIVVESPTKARTIASFFGRPARRRLGSRVVAYETPIIDSQYKEAYLGIIVATRGHIYDLAQDDGVGLYGVVIRDSLIVPVYTSVKRCTKCNEQFSSMSNVCPRCGEDRKILHSKEVTLSLRALAFEVDEVLLASDPDPEGEKIAWDIYNVVAPFSRRVRRIEFHEVTRESIIRALREPRDVNENKVLSQVYRRIVDRWIGFSSSVKLWKLFDKHWLGAGRVQIPVLGWIVDRYFEWKNNKKYVVKIKLAQGPLIRIYYESKERANGLIEAINSKKVLRVFSFRDEIKQVMPPPPLTTDELLLLANYKLGFSSAMTMKLAQELFESGLITYHRTDSNRVSSIGIGIAKQYLSHIGKLEDFVPRTWSDGGAHEAIRPTQPISADELWKKFMEGTFKSTIALTPMHIKLYDLIFKRFIASQMKHSTIILTELRLGIDREEIVVGICSDMVEEGFASVWTLECNRSIRNYLSDGSVPIEFYKIERGSEKTLYREGEIVKTMKEKGIGRPSTYAKTITTLKRHGYIVESKKFKFLVPTKTGIMVYNYLVSNYYSLFSENRTIMLERALKRIEENGSRELGLLIESLLEELKSYSLLDNAPKSMVDEVASYNLRNEIEALD